MRLFSSFSVSLLGLAIALMLIAGSAEAAPKTAAAAGVAFSCSAKEAGAGFDLTIGANGDASAKLNQDGKTYNCPLAIRKFNDQRKAKVPFVGVTFARNVACSPALPPKLSKTLRGDFALNLVKAERKPASNVSFLNSQDDAICTPTNFRVKDFNALIKNSNGVASAKTTPKRSKR